LYKVAIVNFSNKRFIIIIITNCSRFKALIETSCEDNHDRLLSFTVFGS